MIVPHGWKHARSLLAAGAAVLLCAQSCSCRETGATARDAALSAGAQSPRFANIVVDVPGVGNSGQRLIPGLQRQDDCSLVRGMIDATSRTLAGTTLNVGLELHQRARLGSTPGIFNGGCEDPVYGLSAQAGAVAGHVGDGSTFGAAIPFRDGLIEIGVSEGNTGLRSLTDRDLRPEGTLLETTAMASADPDRNGLDFIAVTMADYRNGAGSIAVLQAKADGDFGPAHYYPVPFPAFGLTLADLDGDEHVDIVAVTSLAGETSPAKVAVLYGKPGGGFAAAKPVGVAAGASGLSVLAVDVNHDGRLDIVTGAADILLGQGGRTFSAAKAKGGWGFGELAAGDFDEDGNVDIAVAQQDEIDLYLGRGNGRFDRGARYAGIYGSQHLAVTDLDGDGHRDIVVGYSSHGLFAPHENAQSMLQYLLGRGDGTFAGVAIRDGDRQVLGDFDGDGKADLVTMGGNSTAVNWFRGLGTGGFAQPKSVAQDLRAGDVAAGSFGGGPGLDLVVVTGGISFGEPASLHLRLGHNDGTFDATGSDVSLPFPNSFGNRALALGDFDGDGRRDVAFIGYEEMYPNPRHGGLVTVRNGTDGMLGEAKTIVSNLVAPIDVLAARVDDGTTTDLVVADGGDPYVATPIDGSVRVYPGRGDGTFRKPIVLRPFKHPEAVAVADVDGDGHADVLVAGSNETGAGEQLAVLRGDGTGFAKPLRTALHEIFITGLSVGDIDGDGKPDVATTSCCGLAQNGYLLGKGDGHFRPHVLLPAPISGGRPQLVDLDGDRHDEWVMSLPQFGTVVLKNLGGD